MVRYCSHSGQSAAATGSGFVGASLAQSPSLSFNGPKWGRPPSCLHPRPLPATKDTDTAQRELEAFRCDVGYFRTFSQRASEVPGLAEVVQRSSMGHMATRQIANILDNFEMSPRTADFLTKVHSRLLGSQVVEDGINTQKNADGQAWQNRRGTIRASYKALIEHRPLSTKHRFTEVEVARDPACRDMKLPNRVFQASLGHFVRFGDCQHMAAFLRRSFAGEVPAGLACMRPSQGSLKAWYRFALLCILPRAPPAVCEFAFAPKSEA